MINIFVIIKYKNNMCNCMPGSDGAFYIYAITCMDELLSEFPWYRILSGWEDDLEQWCSDLSMEDLVKHRLLSPTCRVSDSVGLEKIPIICIFNKFSGNTNAACLGTVF